MSNLNFTARLIMIFFTMKKLIALPALAALSFGMSASNPALAESAVTRASDNLAKVCSEALAVPGVGVYVSGFCGTSVVSKCVVAHSKDSPAIVSCINHFADLVQAKQEQVADAGGNAVKNAGRSINRFFHHGF